MITALEIIKGWFRTRSTPTQEQFWATFDSFFHKDETIPFQALPESDLRAYVDGRIEQTPGGGGGDGVDVVVTRSVEGSDMVIIPSNSLLKTFIITPTSDGEIKLGRTAGAADLVLLDGLTNQVQAYQDLLFFSTTTDLHLTGNFQVKFKIEDYA